MMKGNIPFYHEISRRPLITITSAGFDKPDATRQSSCGAKGLVPVKTVHYERKCYASYDRYPIHTGRQTFLKLTAALAEKLMIPAALPCGSIWPKAQSLFCVDLTSKWQRRRTENNPSLGHAGSRIAEHEHAGAGHLGNIHPARHGGAHGSAAGTFR